MFKRNENDLFYVLPLIFGGWLLGYPDFILGMIFGTAFTCYVIVKAIGGNIKEFEERIRNETP